MANRGVSSKPSEFGGVPGFYGNVDAPEKHKIPNVKGILEPHQERTSLTQTKADRADSQPSHGTGGKRVV